MALALTRRPRESVQFSGDVTGTLYVQSVYPYHVVAIHDGRTIEIHSGAPFELYPGVTVELSAVNGLQARLAFTAPRSVLILRSELA